MLSVTNAVKKSGAKGKVQDLETKLAQLVKNEDFTKHATSQDKANITRLKAMIFKYLGQFDPSRLTELVDVLNKAIRDAVKQADRGALAGMYLDRGDAYFALMGKAKDSKRADFRKRALLDYLHTSLAPYKLPGTRSSEVNYRLGVIFSEEKTEGWQYRALRHLQRVKKSKYSDKAKELMVKVRKQNVK